MADVRFHFHPYRGIGSTMSIFSNFEWQRIAEQAEAARLALEGIDQSQLERISELAEHLDRYIQVQMPEIEEAIRQAEWWQDRQKVNVANLAEQGWFPNWFTFSFHLEDEDASDDDLMIAQIEHDWSRITEKVLELCPKRKEILATAFKLHEEGNYIASIPLLLIQADGVCAERFTYFFSADKNTGHRASDQILKEIEDGTLSPSFFGEILIEPFKIRLQLTQGSSKSSAAAKAKGPNRHGILHGSRRHLDYGTKINGFKAISFLSFVVYAVLDEFGNDDRERD